MDYLIIDTHVHFWDMDRFDYFWLKPEYGILYQTYLPEQIRGEMEGAGVQRGVFVQANHLLKENDWVLSLAETHPWIADMVGWVDLTDSDVGSVLDGYVRNARFKGIRHLIHEEADDRWLQHTPAIAAGLTDHRWTIAELFHFWVPPPPWTPPKRPGRPSKQTSRLIKRWCY